MATYQDLEFDWSMLCQECTDCWTDSDLQLAAELGKTLLERNKELETNLKQYQNIIEDQTQEIEYLTKQTAALREVNDSRLRIYEQLEVSIQELERANQRLSLDNSADKKHIKTLCLSIDSLESRCEELQRALDEMTLKQNSQLRRQQKSKSSVDNGTSPDPSSKVENGTEQHNDEATDSKESTEDEELIRLLEQLQELKSLRAKDQRKTAELEEQMSALLQENLALEEQLTMLRQKEEDMKSLQEEISTLEEVRQGQLCGRCLRNVDSRGHDELSLMLDHEEEEDSSVVNSIVSESHRSTIMLQIQDPDEVQAPANPYRVLVEKYEALLEMQRHPASARQQHVAPSTNCLSLQEELQLSGDFNSFNGKGEPDVESDNDVTETTAPNNKNIKKENNAQKKPEKAFSATPTDFSEAETSSSGFSDETSNKATQTEGHLLPPGSFLCSIADGDDCRFSIYDDASPIESRFRKTPEYRQLFREIFAVLKRAAEAKDEGEQLPLLEDLTPVAEAPKVPPVTPAKEELPDEFMKHKTDTKSSNVELPAKSSIAEEAAAKSNPKSPDVVPASSKAENTGDAAKDSVTKENENPKPKAPKQDLLEYLSIGVGVKKKSRGRKHSPMKVLKPSVAERIEQIESLPSSSTNNTYSTRSGSGRRRREFRNTDRYRGSYTESPNRGESPSPAELWGKSENQNSTNGQQRSYSRQTSYQRAGHHQAQSTWDFQPFVSSASQEVAKLKRLEKSYAEVLRLGPQKCNSRPLTTNNHRK